MSDAVVYIARCAEHGLHGQRDECFVCGEMVEHVTFVRADMFLAEKAASYRLRRLLWEAANATHDGPPVPFMPWIAAGGLDATPTGVRELREEYDMLGEREHALHVALAKAIELLDADMFDRAEDRAAARAGNAAVIARVLSGASRRLYDANDTVRRAVRARRRAERREGLSWGGDVWTGRDFPF